MLCTACPRKCGIDRSKRQGLCGGGMLPRVARAALHFWEEPCISGSRGSGAVFFSGCNLSCVFCQNYLLHDGTLGQAMDTEKLADQFLLLESAGAHNINLVTPTPHTAVLRDALLSAKQRGLSIPIVYNTNAYERADTLASFDGLVDVYLPDLKYVSSVLSERFSGAEDYFPVARDAILEMYRQVGQLTLNDAGLATRGLLVRHLVLPGCVDDTRRVLDAIADMLPRTTYLSLMRQYAPTPAITEPPLNRKLTDREYDRACTYCCDLGFENVYIQDRDSADLAFTPIFTEQQ